MSIYIYISYQIASNDLNDRGVHTAEKLRMPSPTQRRSCQVADVSEYEH